MFSETISLVVFIFAGSFTQAVPKLLMSLKLVVTQRDKVFCVVGASDKELRHKTHRLR